MTSDHSEAVDFDVDRFLAALVADLAPEAVFPARLEVGSDRLLVDGRTVDLAGVDRVHVLALGKAAVPQARTVDALLRDALGDRVARPLAATAPGHEGEVGDVEVVLGSHPVCDESSLRAADALLARAARTAPDDLVVLCLSGGGSAIAAAPRPPFTLSDKQHVYRALLDGGASIVDTNLVRRELSRFKNGGLLAACGAGRVVTLITSDVPTRELSVVASGPTLHRPIDDVRLREVVERYLEAHGGDRILAQIDDPDRRGRQARLRASCSAKDALAVAVADHDYLIERARVRLGALGVAHVSTFDGPLDESIERGVERHVERIASLIPREGSFALVSGGELPVHVTGDGEGGRNTEFVLRMARALFVERRLTVAEPELRRLRVLAFATDGVDGPTDHAGGWLTLDDVERARARGIDLATAIADNDSLGYLRAIDRALRTGPTRTNLMDLRVVSRA